MSDPPAFDGDDGGLIGADAMHALLVEHAMERAGRARAKLGGPLNEDNLGVFLTDHDCLRWPTELRFGDGDLEAHQFAEPSFSTGGGERLCVLHVCECYRAQRERHPYIVAYMACAINYGSAATSDLCERYGAALMGMEVDAFYEAVCRIADDRAGQTPNRPQDAC